MDTKFKFALLMLLTCTSVRSSDEKTKEELLDSAAAQLERLAPFRKAKQVAENDPDNSRNHFFYYSNKTNRERLIETQSNEKLDQLRFPLQLLQILGNNQIKGEEFQIERRAGAFNTNPNSLQDLNYDPYQERIKRHGSNSGSFISGIASKVVGGIAGASSGLSKGSSSSSDSSHGTTAYGPPVYSYEKPSFNAWDFKKAILNTVFQAIKAIGGGVLALKGQLIKGGGFLISTKGRLISSTGDVITNLGRNIASSTYVVAPKPAYSHSGYAYNPPSSQTISHEETFEGPPPSSHDYSSAVYEDSYHPQNTFGAASDDDVQAGLVIMTPSDQDVHSDLDPRHPNIQALEESFGGSLKGSQTANIQSSISGGLSSVDHIPKQEPQQLQLPTTKPHLPFVNHNFIKDDTKSYQTQLQSDGYHVEIPKLAPLPISSTNPGNSLHIDYPPHTQNSEQKPSFASIFKTAQIKAGFPLLQAGTFDLTKFPSFKQLTTKEEISFDPQINGYKDPFVSGIPVTLGQQEPLKIPILSQLPKEHRYNFQEIGNGPFPLEAFESFRTKSIGNDIFGGKLISQSLEVQPAVGYTLKETGLHRI